VAFERAAAARWPYTAAHGQLAAMHLTLGDTAAALRAIDTGLALGLEPSWTLYVNRATCCRAMGRYDEAMEDLQRAVALAPEREIDITVHAAAVARAAGLAEDAEAFVQHLMTLGVPEPEARGRVAAVLGEPAP
jgi:tetratricopeptide (TPR) repeat protein